MDCKLALKFHDETRNFYIERCPCYYLHIIHEAENLGYGRVAREMVSLMKLSFSQLPKEKLAGYDVEAVMKMLGVFQKYANKGDLIMAEYHQLSRLVTMSVVERVKMLGIERGILGYPDYIETA